MVAPCCFDPRPRTRGDQTTNGHRSCSTVSIHAPARGATRRRPWRHSALPMFRSTPPHEGRQDRVNGRRSTCWFRSTPPHEGRRAALGSRTRALCRFDPRPRTRGDVCLRDLGDNAALFRSTPPHEGRRQGRLAPERRKQFRSTPPHEGRRHSTAIVALAFCCFDPRPRTRGDIRRPHESKDQ